MAERVRMTETEARQKAEAIRKVILDTYRREVEPSPFFVDLRAGTYQVYCPVADHEERGMTRPLVVQ